MLEVRQVCKKLVKCAKFMRLRALPREWADSMQWELQEAGVC